MTETVERFHCTTPMLRDALRVKLPAGEYSLMHEVRNAAGVQANRSIDVLAMSLWPSRGLYLTGIELKTDHPPHWFRWSTRSLPIGIDARGKSSTRSPVPEAA